MVEDSLTCPFGLAFQEIANILCKLMSSQTDKISAPSSYHLSMGSVRDLSDQWFGSVLLHSLIQIGYKHTTRMNFTRKCIYDVMTDGTVC